MSLLPHFIYHKKNGIKVADLTQVELADTLKVKRQAINAKVNDKSLRGQLVKRLTRFALYFSKEDFIRIEQEMIARLEKEEVNTEQLITEKEAAVLINYKVNTLRTWRCRQKGPPFVRIEGGNGRNAVRYNKKALEDWAKSNAK